MSEKERVRIRKTELTRALDKSPFNKYEVYRRTVFVAGVEIYCGKHCYERYAPDGRRILVDVDTVIEHITNVFVTRAEEATARKIETDRIIDRLHELIWCPFIIESIISRKCVTIIVCGMSAKFSYEKLLAGKEDLTQVYQIMLVAEKVMGPAQLPAGLLPGPIAEEIAYWART